MRLSTRGKYALEALVYLGYASKDANAISLNAISQETSISEGYLEQLFRLLKKDEIVKSKKGKYGGYTLFSSADEITVGKVLLSVEGPLSLVRCSESDCCDRKAECLTHDLWEKAYENITSTINNITLSDIICDYEKKQKADDNI